MFGNGIIGLVGAAGGQDCRSLISHLFGQGGNQEGTTGWRELSTPAHGLQQNHIKK